MNTDAKPKVDLSNLDRKLYPAIELKTLTLAEYLEICGRVEHYDQMAARTKALVEALEAAVPYIPMTEGGAWFSAIGTKIRAALALAKGTP